MKFTGLVVIMTVTIIAFMAVRAYESSYAKHRKVRKVLKRTSFIVISAFVLAMVQLLSFGSLGLYVRTNSFLQAVYLVYLAALVGWCGAFLGSGFSHWPEYERYDLGLDPMPQDELL